MCRCLQRPQQVDESSVARGKPGAVRTHGTSHSRARNLGSIVRRNTGVVVRYASRHTGYNFALIGLPEPQYFNGTVHASHPVVVPYFIPALGSHELIDVTIDALRTPLPDQSLVAVRDTPHFKYLNGEHGEYEAYFDAHVGREICEDHSSFAFDQLHDEFDYPHQVGKKQAFILVQRSGDGVYRILDGNHRAALLLQQGHTEVTVALCHASEK